MQGELEGVEVDAVDADNHVEEGERATRALKECIRGIL